MPNRIPAAEPPTVACLARVGRSARVGFFARTPLPARAIFPVIRPVPAIAALLVSVWSAVASAQGAISLPSGGSGGAYVARGDELVHLDLATFPQTTYRLDALNQPVPSFRVGQWAGLTTRRLAGDRIRVVMNFRYDLDTSATAREVAAFPLLALNRFSLLTAYVEVDATKELQVRVGRQLYADPADYLAFDGLRVAYRLPIPVQLEAYGGLRSSIGATTGSIASSLYELDGVAQVNGLQPVAGGNVRWIGDLRFRQEASIGYRHAWRTADGEVIVDPARPSGPFTTTEELVASGASDVGPVYVTGAFAYSLALSRLVRARASIAYELTDETTTALEYQRYQPAFALDSIWNFFSSQPFDELGASAVHRFSDHLRFEGRAFGRVFQSATADANGNAYVTSPGTQPAVGVRVGAVSSMPLESGPLRLDGFVSWQDGFGGRRLLFDGGARWPIVDNLELVSRLTLGYFAHESLADRASPAFGLVAGVTYRLPWGAGVSLMFEETVNAFASPVPRVFGVLDLARWL